ncbi:hypothetical protein ABZ297_36430 [Nonomuraea sp. NPDC005983]|uniref:hypothetical protein n=1 Tax=Nonomuraea sp. NPDC005983 TaxID=3155595 RepID=UPI0033A625AA
MELRYKYFGANVELIVDDIEIISKKKFVTLVDLALSVSHAAKRLSSGEDAALGFTESEEVILLRRDGDLVTISSSKRHWRVSAVHEELSDAFNGFVRQVHSRLIDDIPELAANPVIQRLSTE